MKLIKNKKAIADTSDPTFWGIVLIFWIVELIALWRFDLFKGDMDLTKIKIAVSIIALPVNFGICYLMGKNG